MNEFQQLILDGIPEQIPNNLPYYQAQLDKEKSDGQRQEDKRESSSNAKKNTLSEKKDKMLAVENALRYFPRRSGKTRSKALSVLGRDHHDVGGTDSPFRETSNITDGSSYTSDMAIQNDADRRLKMMLHWDVNNGIARRSWGRNSGAMKAIEREMKQTPTLKVTIPNLVDEKLLENLFHV